MFGMQEEYSMQKFTLSLDVDIDGLAAVLKALPSDLTSNVQISTSVNGVAQPGLEAQAQPNVAAPSTDRRRRPPEAPAGGRRIKAPDGGAMPILEKFMRPGREYERKKLVERLVRAGYSQSSTTQAIARLTETGKLIYVRYGVYAIPETTGEQALGASDRRANGGGGGGETTPEARREVDLDAALNAALGSEESAPAPVM